MARWILLCAAFTVAALPSAAGAQAAVEYGMASSHSAAATARISRAVDPQLAAHLGPKSKTIESVMEDNRKQLVPKDPKAGGTVHIAETTPAKATVYVDGLPVAYTPADLTLAEGKHDVEVKHPVSVSWEKEVSVGRGDKLSLKPELKDKYKSVLSFTIQQ